MLVVFELEDMWRLLNMILLYFFLLGIVRGVVNERYCIEGVVLVLE